MTFKKILAVLAVESVQSYLNVISAESDFNMEVK